MELDVAYRAAPYVLDHNAIDEARERLDVRGPVEFLIKHMVYRDGTYLGRTFGYHRISLGSHLSPIGASMTIWHELTHAKQCEEWGQNAFDDEYDRQLEEIGLGPTSVYTSGAMPNLYKKIPFEAEAYKNGRDLIHVLLAKRRSQPRVATPKKVLTSLQDLLNI